MWTLQILFAALIPLARCRFISPKQFSRVLHRREHAIGVNQLDHGSAREGSRRHHDHHKPRVFFRIRLNDHDGFGS